METMLGYCRYLLFLIILYLDCSAMSSKKFKIQTGFSFWAGYAPLDVIKKHLGAQAPECSLHIIFDRNITPPMCQMKYAHRHQRQPVISHGAASSVQASPHVAPADIGRRKPPHIGIAPPVLPGPAERSFDFIQQLPSIGRIVLQAGKIPPVHLLSVLPAEPMEVDLVFHLIRQEYRIIWLQARKVALDQRCVHIIDPLRWYCILPPLPCSTIT